MKKEVKLLLTLIVSVFVLGLNVNAKTGTGICYKKTIDSSGYCKLNAPVAISRNEFNYKPIMMTDGTEAAKYEYFGTVESQSQKMFCIDPNLSWPRDISYQHAKPFNMGTDYDRGIAKIYTMYVEDSVALMNKNPGMTFDEASQRYIQTANVAMRALEVKYEYDISGKGFRRNYFDNVVDQLEGKRASNPKLSEKDATYKTVEKYYCSAILSCKKCTKVKSAMKHCEKVKGISKKTVEEFKINVKSTPEIENINTGNDNEFSRIIEIEVSGLKKLTNNYDAYKNTEPFFKITKVGCDNTKLKCSLETDGILNKDLLNGLTGDKYIFKVRITGDKKDFLSETNEKVTVEYEYHHVLNVNNLATLKYGLGQIKHQRMIVLMPKRSEKKDVNVSFPVPAMCQTEIVSGKQIYKYGGKEVEELEYLKSGCCNIKSAYLKDDNARNYYVQNCDIDVNIHLETSCVNDGDATNMSHSYIQQKPIEKVLNNIKIAEDNYSTVDLQNELIKYNYHRDDNYLYTPSATANDAISTKNTYCQMYTSESNDIYYPGTAEASSGRYFIFNGQPYIEGEVNAVFHTNVSGWEKDYRIAINEEKTAYYAWQEALRDEEIEDASSYERLYQIAFNNREKLQTYKTQCEIKSDIINKWNYQLEPDLIFNYQQSFFDPITNKTKKITEKVKLEVSHKSEKYWPNISDANPQLINGSTEGYKRDASMTVNYGSYYERFNYDKTENYKAGFKQTLYYIPKVKYYSLLPNGKYVTSINEFQDTNYIDVGYVFNVNITTYQGEYTTWFTVNNLGHLMQNKSIKPKNTSNVQSLLNEYLVDNKDILNITDTSNNIDGLSYVNKCFYKDEEILYKRECPTCEDDTSFKVQYYTRSVATENLFPNENDAGRVSGANWTNDKGKSAKTLIETASNEIYGDADGSKAYLEYSFTLTPSIMQDIKKYNKKTNYSDFNLKCKINGKECESSLLTELVKNSREEQALLQATRSEGWKYYVDNVWVRGSIAKYLRNGYPETDTGLTIWP